MKTGEAYFDTAGNPAVQRGGHVRYEVYEQDGFTVTEYYDVNNNIIKTDRKEIKK